jgi:hypothetical protein
MYTASIAEIKRELKERSQIELINYCLRLAKFKKDNKELLHYLLFEAIDEENYKAELKEEIEAQFSEINLDSVYYAKKNIRRILRQVTKHIRYSGIKETEIELLICFCQNFRRLPLPFHESRVLINLYDRQIKNITKALNTLDEDLRLDYEQDVSEINHALPGL